MKYNWVTLNLPVKHDERNQNFIQPRCGWFPRAHQLQAAGGGDWAPVQPLPSHPGARGIAHTEHALPMFISYPDPKCYQRQTDGKALCRLPSVAQLRGSCARSGPGGPLQPVHSSCSKGSLPVWCRARPCAGLSHGLWPLASASINVFVTDRPSWLFSLSSLVPDKKGVKLYTWPGKTCLKSLGLCFCVKPCGEQVLASAHLGSATD